MISCSTGHRAEFVDMLREAGRSSPMMVANRSALSCRAILFLSILIGFPSAARSATIEDAATEFAKEIAGTLPPGGNVSIEIRNLSSLRPDEISRIDKVMRTELQDRGVHLTESGVAASRMVVTLSENWKDFIWTCELRQGDEVRAVLLAVPRAGENHVPSNGMHVTVRSERFWEGSQHILDAAKVSNESGKSWFVLLLPSSLEIQDLQTNSADKVNIASAPSNSRDPWGQLDPEPLGSSIWFAAGAQACKINLETRSSPECLSKEELDRPLGGRIPLTIDLAPAGPPPPGKGTEHVIAPVCGGTNQFLATSDRDYTQTDSVQVFQTEANGPAAISGELNFPGPILALHTALEAPRVIVRNLSTGNYEAYRVAISCGQ